MVLSAASARAAGYLSGWHDLLVQVATALPAGAHSFQLSWHTPLIETCRVACGPSTSRPPPPNVVVSTARAGMPTPYRSHTCAPPPSDSPSSSSCGLRVKTPTISSNVSVSPMAAMQNTTCQLPSLHPHFPCHQLHIHGAQMTHPRLLRPCTVPPPPTPPPPRGATHRAAAAVGCV